ncbi:unnamed protein product [Peronospora farinosa]|uniref:Uncharacterized protein n=1 Tax=Peronospora farinosa TaxID=134698 RepID=A0ABN8CBI4_9STRA|nr:unnamed protein product [Peronospora farinosa]
MAKIRKDIPTKIGNNVTVGPCRRRPRLHHSGPLRYWHGRASDGRLSWLETSQLLRPDPSLPTVCRCLRASSGQVFPPAVRDLTAEEMGFMQQVSAEYTQLEEQHAVPQACPKGGHREDTGLYFRN